MPLVILSGYPCSGLSHRARQLASSFNKTQDDLLASDPPVLKSRYKIHIVPTHDSSHPRTTYDNARTEKQTRGVAYARARRVLGKDSIVILDGMNYIKGYRYQLYCEAKELGTTSCVVHVGTPVDQCIANNEARIRRKEAKQEGNHTDDEARIRRKETKQEGNQTDDNASLPEDDSEESYPPSLLDNLIFRYEEPSTHSRWDRPLFTVPWADAEPPAADIWTAITGIPHPSSEATTTPVADISASLSSTQISDAASISTARTQTSTTTRTPGKGGLVQRPKIKPHQATVQPAATGTNELYAFEKRTSAIVTAIRNFTLANPSAEAGLAQSRDPRGIYIDVPESSLPIFIPAHVATAGTTDELASAGGILALPRLQRLRRQWIGLNRAYIGRTHGVEQGGLKPEQIADAFVRFLNADFAGDVEDG